MKFSPKNVVNCNTQGVVDLFTSECGSYYVGKTICEFWRCIHNHIYVNEIGDLYSPIGRHAAIDHKYG